MEEDDNRGEEKARKMEAIPPFLKFRYRLVGGGECSATGRKLRQSDGEVPIWTDRLTVGKQSRKKNLLGNRL